MIKFVEREDSGVREFLQDLFNRAIKQYIEIYCLVIALTSIIAIAVLS